MVRFWIGVLVGAAISPLLIVVVVESLVWFRTRHVPRIPHSRERKQMMIREGM